MMRKISTYVSPVYFSLGIAGCLVFLLMSAVSADSPAGDNAQLGEVIYPPQSIPLHFSHQKHLSRVGGDCAFCHEKIGQSKSSLDNNMPRERSCQFCHDIDRKQFEKAPSKKGVPASCVTCHVGFSAKNGNVQRVSMPIPNLKFSHQQHLEAKVDCQQCHGDFKAKEVGLATRTHLPSMQQCLHCHDGKKADDACVTCHISAAGGYLKTEFGGLGKLIPGESLLGVGHGPGFLESHKYAAQNDSEYCESCHKKSDCIECHDGVSKPMDFHLGDYVNMHTLEARRNSPDCSSCHRIQTFCQGCHSRLGVAGDNKAELGRGVFAQFHPPGWLGGGGMAGSRSPQHHSLEAQRNIKQCASCHRESSCTACHSAQPSAPRISPHPQSWLGSRRCRTLLKKAKRMCLRCHTQTRELDCF